MVDKYKALMGVLVLLAGAFAIAAGAGYADWTRSLINQPVPKLVNTVQFLGAINDDGNGNGLARPLAVAVDDVNELIYVTDTGRNKIYTYSLDGKFLRSIDGSFNYPNALTVDGGGRLYVGEFRSNRIQVFNKEGTLQAVWDAKFVGATLSPLALDFSNKKLYIANRTGEVVVLTTDGQLDSRFGSPGNLKGLLAYPNGIAVRGNSIYVSDSGNGRIQVFNLKGEVTKVVSRQDLPVSVPRGISLDSKGNVYLADTLGHRVIVLDEYMQVKYEMGKDGLSGDKMNFPNDVEVIDNRLYVTDRENGRVLVYALPEVKN